MYYKWKLRWIYSYIYIVSRYGFLNENIRVSLRWLGAKLRCRDYQVCQCQSDFVLSWIKLKHSKFFSFESFFYKGWHWYVSCRCYSMAFNGNSYQVILVIWKFHSLQCTERLVSLATEQQWSLHWNWHFGMVSSVCCGFIAIFEKLWYELCKWSIFICSSLLT